MARTAKYYKRPDGLYETIRKINGKRVAFRGKTCAEVDRKMLEYREQGTKGRPFPVIADEWFRQKIGELSDGSYTTYRAVVKQLKAHFTQRIGDIRAEDAQQYIRQYEAQGRAGASVNTQLTVLNQIFDHAIVKDDIKISPISAIKKSKHLPKKERRPLTMEEERLVDEYRGEDWLIGVILLYTGVRRGELLALTWQDFDFQNNIVHVNKKLNQRHSPPVVDTHLKNAQERKAPLLGRLAELLPRHSIGPIFTTSDGEYLSGSQWDARFARYRKAVGLGEDITAHCFRHSYATMCYEAGVDEKSCAALLGDTETITRQIYQSLRDEHHALSVAKVNALIETRLKEREERQA